MNEEVKVKKVEKTEDGGFVVLFEEGDKKYPISFSNSYVNDDRTINGGRFLVWGATAPFNFDKYELPPPLIIAGLIDQIEEVLNV